MLSVTTVDARQQTNLRFYRADTAVPSTASLNPNPGAPPIPNAANVSLAAADGRFNVYNRFGNVALVIDVMSVYDDHNHDDRYYTKTQAGTQDGGRYYTQTEADDTFVRQGGNIIMRHGTSEMTAVSVPSARSTLENAGTGTVVSGDGAVTISPTGPFDVAGLTLTNNTDRAAAGCYVVNANLDGAQAYDVRFVVKGGAAFTLRLSGLRTTWVPVP